MSALKSPVIPGREVVLRVPAQPEYLRLIRLVVAGVGNSMEFTTEEIEDLKLAVGEACYNACVRDPAPGEAVTVVARLGPVELVVEITQRSTRPQAFRIFSMGGPLEKGMGILLMRHLMDHIQYTMDASGLAIRMVKKRSGIAKAS